MDWRPGVERPALHARQLVDGIELPIAAADVDDPTRHRRRRNDVPACREPPLHPDEFRPDGWIDPAVCRVTAEHHRRGGRTGGEKEEQKELAHAATVRTEVAEG